MCSLDLRGHKCLTMEGLVGQKVNVALCADILY